MHTQSHTVRGCSLPDDIHSSGADFWVTAHDWHASSEGAVDAEDHTLHAPRQYSQVGLRTCLVPSCNSKTETRESCYAWLFLASFILHFLARLQRKHRYRTRFSCLCLDNVIGLRQRLRKGRGLLDHHFNWIDSQSKSFALGYGVCDSAAAVGYFYVKVHPAAGLRLCHQQDVHLKWTKWVNRYKWMSVLHKHTVHQWDLTISPFLPSTWPCPRVRTWSGQPESGVRPRWQWCHSPCGWP